ncbi:DUF3082 domain-containing protein [Leptolyngbya iicbica]|uniref:DUF3082 domain-containing protein n=2 Tax=Cyanophyceae TaxID=3028117 RepID=A0A4Q7DZ87_9CYAN|nr:DUF3082 domain-containing protein [Leptolyngbya sp. LK]RZM74837.1 DUF3082 domain-containing protein [Leptolyngbya sp. LK]
MSTPATPSKTDSATAPPAENPLSTKRILRAFTGSMMAAVFAMLFYKMLVAIATSFANKPVTSDNITVINLSAAVRTLVMGSITLGAGVFAISAIGLFLLGLQMIWQRANDPSDAETTTPEAQD